MLDSNAVPRFHRELSYIARGRTSASTGSLLTDSAAGARALSIDTRMRMNAGQQWSPHFEFSVLGQRPGEDRKRQGCTTVAPLETTDLHDFRVLENGNYLLHGL